MNLDYTSVAIRQASIQASLLVATAGFDADEWADLRQEIILDLLRRAPKFDLTRGDWTGFVRVVARNRATVLVRRKRRRPREIRSEDLVNQEQASVADLLDILDHRPRVGVDVLHLSLDVRRVVENLPTQLQSLAVLLSQMPVRDVCRHTGRSRSRVYQLTRQIREAFLRAGFSPLHPKRPAEPRK